MDALTHLIPIEFLRSKPHPYALCELAYQRLALAASTAKTTSSRASVSGRASLISEEAVEAGLNHAFVITGEAL